MRQSLSSYKLEADRANGPTASAYGEAKSAGTEGLGGGSEGLGNVVTLPARGPRERS